MKRLLLPFVLLPFCSFSQTPVVDWMQLRGSAGNDYATGVVQTTDGGYLTSGLKEYGAYMWLVKFDADGNYQWEQMHGSSAGSSAQSIIQTADGGYATAGITNATDGDSSGNTNFGFWIVKLDTAGAISWQKSYGNNTLHMAANQIIQTADGGYVVAGTTTGNGGDVTGCHGGVDYWVIKLDSAGNLVWQKALGGSGNDRGAAIQQITDGGYIVAGTTNSADGDVTNPNGCDDGWLVKLSATGAIEWEKTIGTGDCESITDMRMTPDGGYLCSGLREYDGLVVKTDALGNVLWERQIGGTDQDALASISLTSNGGSVASGYAFSTDGSLTDVPGEGTAWFIHLDDDGTILWQRRMGEVTGPGDIGFDIVEIAEGQYITCGLSHNPDGDPDTGFNPGEMFIARLITETSGTNNFATGTTMVWPNPASGVLTIALPNGTLPETVTISDSSGRAIANYTGSNLDVSALATGLYIVTATAEGRKFNVKFVKE